MTTFMSGSQWQKWDLHIHAPTSALNNQFEGSNLEEKWGNYLECIESLTDVAVLGITDYFSIEGYQWLQKQKQDGRLTNIKLLIPNVELRILPVTGDNRAINLHVLFDPDPELISNLETYFFQNLEFEFAGNRHRCTRNDLIRLGRAYRNDNTLNEAAAYMEGVNQFKVTHNILRDALRKNEHLIGRYLIGVSNSSTDGNAGIQHSSLAATRQEIYRLSHFIFSANPNDRKYFLGQGVDTQETVEANYGSIKPCIHGSDAHRFEDICKPNQNRFTWIKADPTFDGLMQIIYEPESRVQIQEDNPQHDYPKHYFSLLNIEGKPFPSENLEFGKTIIPLNRDLVTIIGGRGTGKSMLLDTLFHTFNRSDNDVRFRNFQIIPFTAQLKKGLKEEVVNFLLNEEAEQFEYLHVRQGNVKKLVDRPTSLHKEVLTLLGPPTFTPDPLFEKELTDRNEQIAQLYQFLCNRDEAGDLVNSINYHEVKIRQNQALLKTLATDETRKQVEEFTTNSKNLSLIESLNQDLSQLRTILSDFCEKTNVSIDAINKRFTEDKSMHIESINFVNHIRKIESLLEHTTVKQRELMESSHSIEINLAEKGFKGDVANLLSKADTYQRAMQQSYDAIDNLKNETERLSLLIEARNKSVIRIKSDLDLACDDINKRFKIKKEASDQLATDHKELLQSLLQGIEIRGFVHFDKTLFLEGLWNFIDGRKFRSTTTKTKNERLAETIGVNTVSDFFSLLAGKNMIQFDSDCHSININDFLIIPDLFYEGKENDFFDYLFLRKHRENYLQVTPVVQYQGKDLQRLSVGQRGTFYLCLKLATESFSTPFVFDQPEDDLDNEFITNHLLPLFRKIKKYRQVIIATHNANLVVNADSEQIIIATNKDEVLTYNAGSLENPIIRKQICNILEGGEKAFIKREVRYNIRQGYR